MLQRWSVFDWEYWKALLDGAEDSLQAQMRLRGQLKWCNVSTLGEWERVVDAFLGALFRKFGWEVRLWSVMRLLGEPLPKESGIDDVIARDK